MVYSKVYDYHLLRGLEGTIVILDDPISDEQSPESQTLALCTENYNSTPSPATHSALVDAILSAATSLIDSSRTWIILEKLSERSFPVTAHDIEKGLSARTTGKFLCQLASDPDQIAFMRVYKQIPMTGTEDSDQATRAKQAIPAPVCDELEALKLLQNGGCHAAPRFLGYAKRTQGGEDLVPGGYIRYLLWEKVPGEPLTDEVFWGLNKTARDDIRAKFRIAYKQVICCAVEPGQCKISKIIFDQPTGAIYISGFRMGWLIHGKFEWSVTRYVEFGLAKPGKEIEWWLHPENWKW